MAEFYDKEFEILAVNYVMYLFICYFGRSNSFMRFKILHFLDFNKQKLLLMTNWASLNVMETYFNECLLQCILHPVDLVVKYRKKS